MELNKILDQIQQDQHINNDKTMIKPYYSPEKVRTDFLREMNAIVLEKSNNEKSLVLNDEMIAAINLVCQYLNNEIDFLKNEGYSFSKGLWIYGSFGSGKTLLLLTYRKMRLLMFKEIVGFKTCVQMNEAFTTMNTETNKQEGLQGIKHFANQYDERERIFDDLGEEEKTVFDYGNKMCVMQKILSERHKGYPDVKTHITTNLTKQQITDDYGGRIDSRAFEMFNFIVLGSKADSLDHRKV